MVKVVKKSGVKEELDEGKLWDSIYYPARECDYSEANATRIADEVKQRVLEWIEHHEDNVLTVKELRETVIEALEEEDDDVAFMYENHLDLN